MGFIHETAHRCRRAERRIETPQHRRPVIDRNRRAKTAGMFAGRYRFAQHGLAVDSARNGPPAHCGICTRPQWQHQTHCQRPSRLSHPDDPTNGQPHAHGRATVQQHSHATSIHGTDPRTVCRQNHVIPAATNGRNHRPHHRRATAGRHFTCGLQPPTIHHAQSSRIMEPCATAHQDKSKTV